MDQSEIAAAAHEVEKKFLPLTWAPINPRSRGALGAGREAAARRSADAV
jgi:hypothetical protein